MNSKFTFGEASMGNLRTCHSTLIEVAQSAILKTPYDFSIIEGHRSRERQQELFKHKLTHIDGVTKKGKHNWDPSLAFDFCPYPDTISGVSVWGGGSWRFEVVAGVILAVGIHLGISLRWGGDWDGDGSRRDQTFHDLPHIEVLL